MFPFYSFKGGGSSPKGDNVTFFTGFFFTFGLPLVSISIILAKKIICSANCAQVGGTSITRSRGYSTSTNLGLVRGDRRSE